VEQQFNRRFHTFALSIVARAYACLGRWDEAVKEAQKALSVAEEFSDNSLISFVAWNLSIVYAWKGDLARAVEYGELSFQKAPTLADKEWAQRSLGWVLCRSGETARGIELLTTVLPILRGGQFISTEIPLVCFLGEGYWLAGEDDKAKQMFEEGLEMAERYGVRYYAGFAQRLLGEMDLKTNPAQAEIHFERSIAVLQEIKAENELALTYESYGCLYKQQNQIAPIFIFISHGFICIFPRKFTDFFLPKKQSFGCFFKQKGIVKAIFLKECLGYADSLIIFSYKVKFRIKLLVGVSETYGSHLNY
jgi:tetratricopeptide (TPR) repeat protein